VIKQDHYATLGIPRDADIPTIERALSGAMRVTSDSALRYQLRHIRENLLDPARKAAYDQSLNQPAAAPARPRHSAPASSGVMVSPVISRALWLGVGVLVILAAVATYFFTRPKPAKIEPLASTAAVQSPAGSSKPAPSKPKSTAKTTIAPAPSAVPTPAPAPAKDNSS
jgi:hypothetical protein